jgi:hypothetical protein
VFDPCRGYWFLFGVSSRRRTNTQAHANTAKTVFHFRASSSPASLCGSCVQVHLWISGSDFGAIRPPVQRAPTPSGTAPNKPLRRKRRR